VTDTTPGTPDTARVEAFAERMAGVLNDAALALMTSIGHQVGLFDVMAQLPASTSEEIARAAGLHERYVREWLGAMATARIVGYDPDGRTFVLPPEHAACLTRAAGAGNLAVQTQFVPLLGQVTGQIVECFRAGGGVPYSSFHDFHRVMAEDSATVHDAALLDAIVPVVPDLPARLGAGIDVADIGCGSGHAVNLLAQAFPRTRFVGYDFSEEAIAAARREAEMLGVANARFEVQDVAGLDVCEGYDLITAFDAIHDQAHPVAVLEAIATALRADGTFLMVDIRASSDLARNLDHPLGPFLYSISTMHCMTVSLSLDGDGLGTVWGEELAQEMLRAAGFERVEVTYVEDDLFNTYYLASKR
jgi:SAM-dependent methyltransferase